MTSRHLRWAFLACVFLSTTASAVTGYQKDAGGQMLAEGIVFTFITLMWVNADARQRNLTVNRWFKIGVIFFAGVFVPVYLIRTRGWKFGAKSLAIFIVQFLGISFSGAIIGAIIRRSVAA